MGKPTKKRREEKEISMESGFTKVKKGKRRDVPVKRKYSRGRGQKRLGQERERGEERTKTLRTLQKCRGNQQGSLPRTQKRSQARGYQKRTFTKRID